MMKLLLLTLAALMMSSCSLMNSEPMEHKCTKLLRERILVQPDTVGELLERYEEVTCSGTSENLILDLISPETEL